MKSLYITLMAALLVGFGTATAAAQKKTGKKAPVKKTPAVATIAPLDVRNAREKIENQKILLDRFIVKFANTAETLRQAESDMRANKLKPATAEMVRRKKEEYIQTIRNFEPFLSNIESEFRTKPALKKYLASIEGVSLLISRSGDTALTGDYLGALEPLRAASQKLNDTLIVLPR